MATWIWVLIPLAAIMVGAFKEWLKFKDKQSQLGSSAAELEKTVAAQKAVLAAALQRIQNLEAIVTTQMWDVVHDDALPEAEKQRALVEARLTLDPPAPDASDADRVAQLAQRMKL